MRQDKYWASKVPLPLALLFLLNVFLIIAVELLFFYKYPAVADEAVLGKYDPAWIGGTVINRDDRSSLLAYLIETPEEETRLLVVKRHSIAHGRGRVLYDEPVQMPESGELTVPVRNGIHTSEISIMDIPSSFWSVTVEYSNTGTIKETTAWYMFLAAVLEALELIVIHFVKKNLQ